MSINILEKHVASIFRAEEQIKIETSMKQMHVPFSLFHVGLLLRLYCNPED
jgi:hypothetical protein